MVFIDILIFMDVLRGVSPATREEPGGISLKRFQPGHRTLE